MIPGGGDPPCRSRGDGRWRGGAAVAATATRSGLAASGRAAASLTSGDPFPARPRDFVIVRGGKFSVDGKPLRFGGTFDYPYSNYEGDRWKDFLALPTIDYGTVHLYPQGWGENPSSKPGTDPITWGTTWIANHISDGAALGKPVVLEEYGLAINAAQGVPDETTRDVGYQKWTDTVLANGGAGDQFWLLTARVDDGSFYPNYDGYRIIWDNDPSNTTNAAAHLLSAHAKAMTAAS